MNNTLSFLIGVLSSIIGTLIIYLFRYQIGFLINIIFSKVYPNVTGEYLIYQYNYFELKAKEESIEKEYGDKPQRIGLSYTRILKYVQERDKEKNIFYKIKLAQTANLLHGELIRIEHSQVNSIDILKGRVTPTRVVILASETKTRDHHNFGTFLLNLSNDGKIMKGTRCVLCINCGSAYAAYQILEKLN